MRWEVPPEESAGRLAAAHAAAVAWAAGDEAPALALLGGWALARDPASREGLLRRLRPPAGPAPEALAPQLHALHLLGEQLDTKERRAWAEEPYAEDELDDAAAARLWRGWFLTTAKRALAAKESRLVLTQEARWAAFAEPEVRPAFAAFTLSLELAPERRREIAARLGEALYPQMLGGKEGPPGWKELAVRVVETAGGGPVTSVAYLLDPARLDRLSACAVGFGEWGGSLATLLPSVGTAPARAQELARRAGGGGAAIEAWIELHAALRVLSGWQREGVDLERGWRTALQARGIARGRLRALAAEVDGEELLGLLLALPALGARTRAALRRYAWSWARQEQDRGFPLGGGVPLHPPCRSASGWTVVLSPEEEAEVREWAFDTVLRGLGRSLHRWVRRGGAGDGAGGWGRALGRIPPSLRGRGRGRYDRLRTWLHPRWGELAAELRRSCAALARLRPSQLAPVRACMLTWYTEPSRLPTKGFPTFLKNAAAFAAGPGPELDEEFP